MLMAKVESSLAGVSELKSSSVEISLFTMSRYNSRSLAVNVSNLGYKYKPWIN